MTCFKVVLCRIKTVYLQLRIYMLNPLSIQSKHADLINHPKPIHPRYQHNLTFGSSQDGINIVPHHSILNPLSVTFDLCPKLWGRESMSRKPRLCDHIIRAS